VSALRRISSLSRVTAPGTRIASPAREGMAADEGFWHAKLAAERAHFVLEQFAQRLDQLHLHVRGQAADIVMRLDGADGPPVAETLSITSG